MLIRHCAGGGGGGTLFQLLGLLWSVLPLFAALVAAGNPSLCCWPGLCSAKLLGSTAGNPFVSSISSAELLLYT